MTNQTAADVAVHTYEYEPDPNDLGWSTLQNLGVDAPSPGPDRIKINCFRKFLQLRVVQGTAYANPAFVVTATRPTREFIRQARWAQRTWLKRLRTMYQGSGRLKREMRRERQRHPLLVQFAFTGILFIRGQHVHPQNWPKGERVSQASVDLTGKVFGRLTARCRLPGARWRCDCSCGKSKVVKTCHLQSGRTKSCGCWEREINDRRQRRKRQRAFLYSGEFL